MRVLTFVASLVLATSSFAAEYKGIFWNLESGESDADTIASQMSAKGNIDFWGLSEVPNQAFLDTLVLKIKTDTGANYVASLSANPNTSDKLAIIFNADRLTSEPYGGTHPITPLTNDFFEVATVQISAGLRPSLGIQLRDEDNQSVVILVNHFKAFGGSSDREKRKTQAEATDVFITMTPVTPVIVGGDHNMPLQAGGSGLTEPAFGVLDQQLDYLKPTNAGMGTWKGGSVLDSAWLANDLAAYTTTVTVLDREGNSPSTTPTFADSQSDTDHRPLLLTIESDAEDRIEALKEDIAALESILDRMKTTLSQLQAGQ